MDRKKIIRGLECCIPRNGNCQFNQEPICPYVGHCKEGDFSALHRDILALLKEQESTLGLHIDSSGIHMSSTGDASQGEQRGLLLGKAMMHEYIEKELLYKGLLTDEIRQVLDSVKRELI